MKSYNLEFVVNSTEIVCIKAKSLEEAVKLAMGDNDFDMRIVTNLKYDAKLVSVKECE